MKIFVILLIALFVGTVALMEKKEYEPNVRKRLRRMKNNLKKYGKM